MPNFGPTPNFRLTQSHVKLESSVRQKFFEENRNRHYVSGWTITFLKKGFLSGFPLGILQNFPEQLSIFKIISSPNAQNLFQTHKSLSWHFISFLTFLKIFAGKWLCSVLRCIQTCWKLTYFILLFHFYAPRKIQKILVFLTFSGVIVMKHWVKIG